MKLLYAIQGTGNGHTSRAREIIPHLMQYGQVDLLLSGAHTEVSVGTPVLYRLHGMGFKFGKDGGISLAESLRDLRPWQFVRDIYALPVKKYDLILNDFEPVSAHAANKRGMPIHAVSHQAAFLSPKSPRPPVRNAFAEWLFTSYAPSSAHTAFHFEAYDDFIHTPVIRSEVRALQLSWQDHVTVYLPAYEAKKIIPHLVKCREVQWHLFSKHDHQESRHENVWIRPVSNADFLNSMASAQGVLTGAGFESPAEALFCKKKLMVVPMKNQYEQLCNAAALDKLGVPVVSEIGKGFDGALRNWIKSSTSIKVAYPNQTSALIERIVDFV